MTSLIYSIFLPSMLRRQGNRVKNFGSINRFIFVHERHENHEKKHMVFLIALVKVVLSFSFVRVFRAFRGQDFVFRCSIFLLLLLMVTTLAGCAADQAHRKANALVESADYEGALEQYRAAIKADPQNSEYRLNYLKARDLATAEWLTAAERAAAANRGGEATGLYRRVLRVDENNARALSGIRALERDNRHAQYVAEAQAMSTQNDLDGALARLRIDAMNSDVVRMSASSMRASRSETPPAILMDVLAATDDRSAGVSCSMC